MGSNTLSRTVRHGKSTGDWKTTPMSRRGPMIGVPWSFTSPRLAGSNPARIFRSVDLPQPEGPTTATNSPSATVKSMPSSATTVPRGVAYSLRKSLTQITSAERPMAPEVYQASARPVSNLRGRSGKMRLIYYLAALGALATSCGPKTLDCQPRTVNVTRTLETDILGSWDSDNRSENYPRVVT